MWLWCDDGNVKDNEKKHDVWLRSDIAGGSGYNNSSGGSNDIETIMVEKGLNGDGED